MSVTLTFTVKHRAGNFARIISALSRLGFKPSDFSLDKSADSRVDKIQMSLKAVNQVDPATLKKLKKMVPTIVDIEIDAATVARARASAKTAASVAAARQAVRVDPVTPAAAPPTVSSLPKFDAERLNFETKRLAGAYPKDIHASLKYVDTSINPAQREEVLTELGNRIGMYAARKRKAEGKDGGINQTVRDSLAMQKSQFGRVSPVVAGMMKRKAAKQAKTPQSRAKVLISELNSFLNASLIGNDVHIANCPHCESSHTSQGPDCYFVTAFIHSFIKDAWGISTHAVVQTKSKATGANSCAFVVAGVELV